MAWRGPAAGAIDRSGGHPGDVGLPAAGLYYAIDPRLRVDHGASRAR
jgi:hypothetical protein